MGTKVIEVDPKNYRGSNPEDIDEYITLLNGLSYCCQHYDEYQEGMRNNIAVDFTVASFMLGLPVLCVLNTFMHEDLIDEVNDDEFPVERVSTVLRYNESFSWNYMIDPDHWLSYGNLNENDVKHMKVFFKRV